MFSSITDLMDFDLVLMNGVSWFSGPGFLLSPNHAPVSGDPMKRYPCQHGQLRNSNVSGDFRRVDTGIYLIRATQILPRWRKNYRCGFYLSISTT